MSHDLRRLSNWNNIPQDLRDKCVWAVASMEFLDEHEIKRDKSPRGRDGRRVQIDEPADWMTYDEAVAMNAGAIGFLLQKTDDFVFIDIDSCKMPEEEKHRDQALRAFSKNDKFQGTYIEKSYSGTGYHILLRGENSDGRRRNPFEIYTHSRFVITTGDVISDEPIRDAGALLKAFRDKVNLPADSDIDRPEIREYPQVLSDEDVYRKMRSDVAVGARIRDLMDNEPKAEDNNWSELDLAFASYLVRYTRNREQFVRIFRATKLYRGDNGKKVGYHDKRKYEQVYLGRHTYEKVMIPLEREELENSALFNAIESAKDKWEQAGEEARDAASVDEDTDISDMPLPPIEKPKGLVGDVAQYFYDSAYIPLWESAMGGAITLIAAMVGRGYNINGSGLSLYTVILGQTGVGKETGTAGIQRLMSALKEQAPTLGMFMGASHLASGPAVNAMLTRKFGGEDGVSLPSKLVIMNEFSQTLRQMLKPNANDNMVSLKRVLLDAFAKSAWSASMEAMVYADQKRHVPAIRAPNLCILGDTTPEDFSDFVTVENIRDGFFPRFLVLETRSDRAEPQLGAGLLEPDPDLVSRLTTLGIGAIRKAQEGGAGGKSASCTNIEIQEDAMAIFMAFEQEVNDKIKEARKSDAPEAIQVWNRAGLKTLRVAGVIAVGNHPTSPSVDVEIMNWSIALIRRDMLSIETHLNKNNTADARHEARMKDLHAALVWYSTLTNEQRMSASVRATKQHVDVGVISVSVLRRRLSKLKSFTPNQEAERFRDRDQLVHTSLDSAVRRGWIIREESRTLFPHEVEEEEHSHSPSGKKKKKAETKVTYSRSSHGQNLYRLSESWSPIWEDS